MRIPPHSVGGFQAFGADQPGLLDRTPETSPAVQQAGFCLCNDTSTAETPPVQQAGFCLCGGDTRLDA